MFEGFETTIVDTGDVTIRVLRGGDGPPLLLLHGHPQTHVMWHKGALLLARDFTVVAADLRGYGQSSKPHTYEMIYAFPAPNDEMVAGVIFSAPTREEPEPLVPIAEHMIATLRWGGEK